MRPGGPAPQAHLAVVVSGPRQEAQARDFATFAVLAAAVAADHLGEVFDALPCRAARVARGIYIVVLVSRQGRYVINIYSC